MVLAMTIPAHKPVLVKEVVSALNMQPGKTCVDCTVGLGGHSLAILEKMGKTGRLLGIDADSEAINIAREKLQKYSDQVVLVKDNFINLKNICRQNSFFPTDGVLFDLGVSSLQLDTAERGFSFRHNAEPDMRFSREQEVSAMDIVNMLPENSLSRLLWDYGEEYKNRQIANSIVRNRPIRSTTDLAKIIEGIAGSVNRRIHPATKTFLALRIAVNKELENLEKALNQTTDCLRQRGRLVVISYHSLEDRIVKQFLKRESRDCICSPDLPACVCNHVASIKLIEKKIITPTAEEIKDNPRSRSAKLRVVERL